MALHKHVQYEITPESLADELKTVSFELGAARALYSDECRRSNELLEAARKAEDRIAELEAQLADVKAAHEADLKSMREHAHAALNLRVQAEKAETRIKELEAQLAVEAAETLSFYDF